MAIGKVGSFASDRPVEDAIGPALRYSEQMNFRYKEEDAKAKALKKADDDAKLKDYADWDGKFDPKIIGNSSIDDPLIGMAMKAKQRAADINRELYSTTDFNKKAALMSERNKLLQSFDIANQTPVLIKQKVKDLQEGIEKGKYNPRDVDFIEKIAKNLETGKYELDYNDRGVASVKIYDTDENGKPTGVLKETSLGDLANAFQPKLAFSYEKYKDDTLKNVKPDEFGTQKGAVIIEGKRISPKNVEQSKTYADVIINDPNKIYEAQFLFNEKDPEKLRIALEKDFLTSIPEGQTQTLDTGYLNYGLSKKKQEEEEIKIGVADFGEAKQDDFMTTDKKIYRVGRDFVLPKEVTFPESKVTFKNLGGENSDLNSGYITSVTKDKEGRFVASGKAIKQKNIKYKGEDTPIWKVVSEAENGDKEAELALSGYSLADIYGRFTRVVPEDEMSSIVLKTPLKTLGNLGRRIDELNKNENKNPAANKSTTKPKKKIKGF